jgi:hypothetical protein
MITNAASATSTGLTQNPGLATQRTQNPAHCPCFCFAVLPSPVIAELFWHCKSFPTLLLNTAVGAVLLFT